MLAVAGVFPFDGLTVIQGADVEAVQLSAAPMLAT
jgi:hypothetical protein